MILVLGVLRPESSRSVEKLTDHSSLEVSIVVVYLAAPVEDTAGLLIGYNAT